MEPEPKGDGRLGRLAGRATTAARGVTAYLALAQLCAAIQLLFRQAFQRTEQRYHESFNAAAKRLRLPDGLITVKARQLRRQVQAATAAAFLALAWTISLAAGGGQADGQALWALSLLASLIISLAAAAAALSHSFRLWQIRNRRLGGLGEFLANPKEWWPDLPAH